MRDCMPALCSAQGMPGGYPGIECPGNARGMPGECPGNARGMPGECPGNDWGILIPI
jgi:hypothetical protein